MKVGVLALQGAVREHLNMIEKCGAEPVAVKKVEQLDDLSGLIIPGGESTTIGKLIRRYGFRDPLLEKGQNGFPLFGTCAGLIVLAKTIEGGEDPHLPLMDIRVQRNAFGRQRDSFETDLHINGVGDGFRAVFIRAPLIVKVGEGVEVLARHKDQIVAARQNHLLAASFHPELTDDSRFHRYFLQMVQAYQHKHPVETK
ncbi:pyridoxal 5'-phosphate synthase subunit PdxT [Caldalkalibacillus thermarum]|uniref:pyridoxal 5'-phosphate synthase glutaminase subunit PdxT n=1 Tax=Caldalkalibacillus thermarum TaxID=296745 RepID=UPI00166A8F5C|nr:pyridoxal 5'-phosphate synthase glutaminase subunit PdxT [Caldalkalibacillus thermarum]GGK35852.1 pyridoxal 5'-phosphate synthase subunit PdxT [Caldalkalibacillus thermarum]